MGCNLSQYCERVGIDVAVEGVEGGGGIDNGMNLEGEVMMMAAAWWWRWW